MAKRISILAVLAIVSAAFWFFSEKWVADPTFGLKDWHLWALPLVLLIILSVINVLALMLVHHRWLRLAAGAIPGLVFLIIFGFKPLYIWLPALIILAQWYSARLIDDELKARMVLNAKAVAKRALPYIILPLFVALSLVYSQNPAIQSSAEKKQLPAVVTETITQVSRQVVEYQTQQQNLTPQEQQQIERAVVREMLNQVNAWVRPYLRYFEYLPFLAGLGMFLVLWGFAFIYNPLTLWTVKGLFYLLKKWGFIAVEESDIKAQRILSL